MKRGILSIFAVATLWAVTVGPASSVSAAGPTTECANANAGPRDVGATKLRKAMSCLIAEERAAADRRRVRNNRALKGIARRHNKVMLEQNCFDHQCAGEAPLGTRIERSSYVGPGDRYGFGENLGFAPTPKSMMDRWMSSRPHRRNILNRRFRHVGVAAGRGKPTGGGGARNSVTFTVLFAWRKG